MRAPGTGEGLGGRPPLWVWDRLGPQECRPGAFALRACSFPTAALAGLCLAAASCPAAPRPFPSCPCPPQPGLLPPAHPSRSASFVPLEVPASAPCVLTLPDTHARVHACSHVPLPLARTCVPCPRLPPALRAPAPVVCRAEAFPTSAHPCFPLRSPVCAHGTQVPCLCTLRPLCPPSRARGAHAPRPYALSAAHTLPCFLLEPPPHRRAHVHAMSTLCVLPRAAPFGFVFFWGYLREKEWGQAWGAASSRQLVRIPTTGRLPNPDGWQGQTEPPGRRGHPFHAKASLGEGSPPVSINQ